MSEIRQTGKTVEAAITSALEQLNALRDQVDVQVITEGKKGFLGFGAVPAEVLVKLLSEESTQEQTIDSTPTESVEHDSVKEPAAMQVTEVPVTEDVTTESILEETEEILEVPIQTEQEVIEETQNYIRAIATDMGVEDLEITYETDGKVIHFQLESEKAAFLIGKRGTTLNSLQQLAQLVANKGTGGFKVVRIDVGDYRIRREQSLEQLANRMADKAIRSGRKVQLEPMPSNERKVLHHTLSDRLDVETYSEGKDPRRYLVIEPIV